MDIQNIIEKVKKLRQLQKSSNVNEASVAAGIAERLIAEHNIKEAELIANETKIAEPIIEAQKYLYETGKVVNWKANLAQSLANQYGVYIFNDTDYATGRKQTRYCMVGTESDIQVLQYTFDFLILEIQRLCDLNCKSDKRGISVERNSYCQGATDGIIDKMKEEKKIVEQSASSAALVVINNKGTDAKKYAHQTRNLKSETSYSHSKFDSGAYQRGKSAGSNINVSSGLGGGKQTGLLK